jgi:UDP-N-acetylmuramate: L-alanyl-gamma-D-glutamyl-meso-diaminopimelate ligase
VLANVFKSEAIPVLERLEPSHVIESLGARGVPAVLCADADAIVSEIVPRVRHGDVIAILSNGGFGGIYETLPKAIEKGAHLERRRDG